MALLGVEASLAHPIDNSDLIGAEASVVALEDTLLRWHLVDREGTYVEPTQGQIWPRYAT